MGAPALSARPAAAVTAHGPRTAATTDLPAQQLSMAAIGIFPDSWSTTPIVAVSGLAESFAISPRRDTMTRSPL